MKAAVESSFPRIYSLLLIYFDCFTTTRTDRVTAQSKT